MKGKASKTKRSYGKKRSYRKKSNNNGRIVLTRKCPEFWLQNTGVAGVPRLGWIGSGGTEVSYTGTNMTLGTPTLGMNGSSDIPFAMNFKISDLETFSDIVTLCDKYKLSKVYIQIMPSFSNNPISGIYNWPQFSYVFDYDDATPAPVSAIRQKQGLKTIRFNPNRPIKIAISPKYLTGLFNNPLNTTIEGAGVGKSGFIDSNAVNIAHFGIKGYFGNVDLPINSTSKFGFKVDMTYKIIGADYQ